MPHAVTHVLIAIIIGSLIRDYIVKDKKKFPLHYVLILGIAGLVPDIDVAVYYVLSFFGFTMSQIHRTFSHNLFIPLLFVLLAGLFFSFKSEILGHKHLKLRNIFLITAFGIFIHLILF